MEYREMERRATASSPQYRQFGVPSSAAPWPPDGVRHRPPPLDDLRHFSTRRDGGHAFPVPTELTGGPYLAHQELAGQYALHGMPGQYQQPATLPEEYVPQVLHTEPPPGLYRTSDHGYPHHMAGMASFPGLGGPQHELAAATRYPVHLETMGQYPPPSPERLYQEEPRYLSMQQQDPLYLAPLQDELRRLSPQQDRIGSPYGPGCAAPSPLQRHLSSPAGMQSPLPYHPGTPPPVTRFSPQLVPFVGEPAGGAETENGDGEFGTARISDNLAAHLSQMEAPQPQFEPAPPPAAPPAPAGGQSFLSSLFGGWLGDCSAADGRLPVSFGVKPDEQPPSPPPPAAEEEQEPAPAAAAAAPATPEPPAVSAAPAAAAPAAEPARPSYSAVLAKPPPPPPPPLLAASQRAEMAAPGRGSPATVARGQAARGGETEGGGSRRGGRGHGRRRRSSDTAARPARGSPADGTPVRSPPPAASDAEPPRELPPPTPGKHADTGKKKKRGGKASRSESVDDASVGRGAETLNNNPDRAQPPVQRRPLNYNNNLGSSSTLGPAQTHVHAPPPPPAAGDKKIDVNVGKQKNCGKTSNESKKVEETMNKPDNKTLSQSRSAQPLNLLTPGAAKSERVSKELAFRPRAGRTARSRRDPGEPGGELVRRLAAQLTPGLSLVAALLAWLAHLVCDVTLMSSRLIGMMLISVAEAARLRACRAASGARAAVAARLAAARDWWRRPAASGTAGLAANIALPATGDDAMKRLLACKDKDPYSILGVTHDCSDADIKKYYRRQALLVHPDKSRSPGAEEAFKILRRAFELVGFPEQRAAFDAQAKEQHEVDKAFREYTEELMTRLREKIEETQNTLRCNNCNQRHRRSRTQRPCYAARACATCKIQHNAREGDIWAESTWLGLFWRYYACMDGAVFDISEWAACQSQSLKHLQANHHTVQYRIISGAKRHRQPADEPSDRDLEDILSNLYSGSMNGDPPAGQRRRGGRRRAH